MDNHTPLPSHVTQEPQLQAPAPAASKKKHAWFSKITTKEEAKKVIKDARNGFYILAAIEILAGLFVLGIPTVVDGVLFGVLAFLMDRFNSRIAAVVLLLLAIAAVFVTIQSSIGGGAGGRNVFLSVIVAVISIRAVQATLKFHNLQKT